MFDIKRSEINGPILQFQSTIFEKEDVKKLIKTINKACGDFFLPEDRLEKAFEVWYPNLQEELNNIKKDTKEEQTKEPEKKGNQEILEEILELTRINQKLLRSPDVVLPAEYLRQVLGDNVTNNKSNESIQKEKMMFRELESKILFLRKSILKHKTENPEGSEELLDLIESAYHILLQLAQIRIFRSDKSQ